MVMITTLVTLMLRRKKISYNSTTGIWGVSEEKITYAPVNSCTYNGSGSFTYGLTDPPSTTDAITADLEDISDSASWYLQFWTAPTAPSAL